MGTPLQGTQEDLYVYDTGSGYLTVSASDCVNCYDHIYDAANSSTSSNCTTWAADALYYGSTTLYGNMVNDTACITNEGRRTCVSDFCFFSINEEYGLNNDAGIFGFGPPYPANGPSFFKTLVDQQDDWLPIMAWDLKSNPEESFVDLGFFIEDYVVGEMIPHNITENAPWW